MSALQRAVNQWPLAWSLARSAHFALQQRTLPWIEYAITGRKRVEPPDPKAFFKYAHMRLFDLLKRDSENIQAGLYPAAVLRPENPLAHWRRTFSILRDGLAVARRRKDRTHNDFTEEAQDLMANFPEYYKRNFHYQTDGYFSDHSANIYEHQVEILFAGAADPMRRLILPLLKNRLPGDGAGLKFLELGSGTGRLTKFIKLAYPKAQVTVVEASDAYLSKSREQLKGIQSVDFMHGFGEDLPFKDQTYDVVYSCFLFHELPHAVRKSMLGEARRVLKPGGWLGFVDSMQIGDDEHMDWALEQFPQDFHEPFYTDYIKRPMEKLFVEAGFGQELERNVGFLSKALLAQKND